MPQNQTDVAEDVGKEPGTVFETAGTRYLAAEHWLLASLEGPGRNRARMEWQAGGVALLRLGLRYSAIRIPGRLVRAVAGTGTLADTDAYLAEALDGGPVISDPHSDHYYPLVPGSAVRGRTSPSAWRRAGVDLLGQDTFLGVPAADRTLDAPAEDASYWAVPMPSLGELCDQARVAQLVDAAVRASTEEPQR
ncbi:hypothetical protein ACIQVK_25210 [Streptomyces sp. NPDC090493]|uniref:hypothetical protein n=1 Tax=Streptomyces sp. NPDC090493 TaxID=3365964 RepID=UPI00380881FB